ncbi:esterase-like activity of phytase family protein [Streptomyces sp. NRRL S-455]|uniref:esterase-like activity of phytase family protein n=1 Tax=Streptomyces sp. NRRL S-455 TaxID=1463908 RepID=UPI0009978C7D|nr:esterase-like activity of phytase family protein [Streptomyces sp. NRRL S-455]
MPLRTHLALLTAALAAATCLTAAGPAQARTSHACSPSVSIDRFSDALDKTTYGTTFVGNFSALAVNGDRSLAALSDRSALFRLDARTLRPRSVTPLTDETGTALDSEGLVVDRDGTYLVTSETEPSVRRYSRTGKLLDRLPVPDDLRVPPAGRARPNGTFEGLTLFPDGRTLMASMEYPLSGDPADTVRLQTWKRDGAHFRLAAQYTYRTDPGLGVPEIQATPDGRLLVLERGFTAGVGNTVRLYLADPRHGTRKTLLTDLVTCPPLGATAKQPQPNPLLDNIEAMTITGRTKNTLKVLLASDDNENPAQTTRLYHLRVRADTQGRGELRDQPPRTRTREQSETVTAG